MSSQRSRSGGSGKNRRLHQSAWAPYNFVPMPDKPLYAKDGKTEDRESIPQRHDVYTEERHTGYFDVTLTTETPLFVRGMLTVDEQKEGDEIRKKPDAFSVDGQRPAIPGSSLRGMIRTLVEIATFSKMHFVSDNKLVYRSVFGSDALARDYRDMVAEEIGDKHFMYPSTRIRGGYLERGDSKSGWVIRPAQAFHGESFVLVDIEAIRRTKVSIDTPQQVRDVYVRPATRSTYHSRSRQGLKLELAETHHISQQPERNLEPAKLIISGVAPRRHWYAAIYAISNDSSQDIPISQEIWEDYLIDRELHRGILNRKLEKEGDPLFYLVDDREQLIFFGPTMFFRMPYEQSIGDLMDRSLRQQNPHIDYAEAMFGYVSEQDETRTPSAYAGRISVTSAQVTDAPNGYYDEEIVPKILASPKPTTFQHYLEQPNGTATETHQLRHYGDDTTIRGHKLYWRQMIKDLQSVKDSDQNKEDLEKRTQHTVIRPVQSGVRFQFRVYFENLSDVELGALIWVLTLGGDSQARHQLGMGKPFGLGVVRLTPTLILTPRHERYKTLFDDDGNWFTAEQEASAAQQAKWVAAFKEKMDDFDDQPRIQELMVLLRMQEVNPRKFSYMQIESRVGNDYQGRPVLPYPSEVED